MNEQINERMMQQTQAYSDNYEKYGYSVASMIMPSDRRAVRYYELLKNFEFFQKGDREHEVTICDAGCGFGDVNDYLQQLGFYNYWYLGLDMVDHFLEEGRRRYGSEQIQYIKRNFTLDSIDDLEFDYAISSQTFTIPYTEKNENYEVIYQSIRKLFTQCRKGVSFNFFTDQGDFQHADRAYHSPAKLLDFAYTLSNRVILDNGCFPYECTITILKDTDRKENGMIFDSFMDVHQKEFTDGIFVVKEK